MTRSKKIILSITIAMAALIVFGTRFYLNLQEKKKYVTCLSAVIPSVVLHHQQEEIVQLLQGLAEDSGETVPNGVKQKSVAPMFSSNIDDSLIQIAEIFKNQKESASLEDSNVSSAVDKSVELFKKESPEFLKQCSGILKKAENKCGPIDSLDESRRECLNEFSPEITALVQKYQPKN